VDTCRFVIHTNMNERTNEIKEHRHVYACIFHIYFVDLNDLKKTSKFDNRLIFIKHHIFYQFVYKKKKTSYDIRLHTV
jgi:hypothetical protein